MPPTLPSNLTTFIHDAAERSARAFVAAFAAFLVANINTADLTAAGIKALIAGAVGAGVSVVISAIAKQTGDPGTASFNPEIKSIGTDTKG
jgi:hypothetical protein